MKKVTLIFLMLGTFVLLYLLIFYETDTNLGGSYYKRHIGDDIEIYSSKSSFGIPPRIFYLKALDKKIYAIQRDVAVGTEDGTANIRFERCRYFVIDVENGVEYEFLDISALKVHAPPAFFGKLAAEAQKVCGGLSG
ncbi:hypothetical protein GCM10023115_00290 [Pontixanthobacter gangjinensis]|uniref:Uncharacterized protein n=1 Tax=Pontixanthobacter gangjinensis TaxID=1028742 RepID=A0A6I4SI30_9SPHN|nr:hypothetical protein [Pontixanthobacter gangjinensis]MXO55279.1 hypothetical protein [Pontixanthobacter gangjinensis]